MKIVANKWINLGNITQCILSYHFLQSHYTTRSIYRVGLKGDVFTILMLPLGELYLGGSLTAPMALRASVMGTGDGLTETTGLAGLNKHTGTYS